MSGLWPGDTRCVVVLGFDIDGQAGAIYGFPQTAALPGTMSQREYGPAVGTARILDLLGRYGLHSTFFIPAFVAETHETMVRDIVDRGHEVGHHGYMHEPPASLTRDQEARMLDKSTAVLERITGAAPRGYRSPLWDLSPHSVDLLIERGFLYDSSLFGDDAPYWVESEQGRMVEIPVHWELDDYPFFEFSPAMGVMPVAASPDQVFEVWSAAFDGLYRLKRTFVLAMHPFVIGRPGRLRMLERLIRYMKGFPGVQFATCEELAGMVGSDFPTVSETTVDLPQGWDLRVT
jgi:peptidoglycan/xylan/chitin deacetylase (PgdA/CDA1 family)